MRPSRDRDERLRRPSREHHDSYGLEIQRLRVRAGRRGPARGMLVTAAIGLV